LTKLFLATAILLGLGSSALAADVITAEPQANLNWTGGYLGASIGYGWAKADTSYDNTGFPGFGASVNPDGFLGGIYGGFNYQFDNHVVLGAEADINYADIRGDGVLHNPAGVLDNSQTFESRVRWEGAIRARAGYAIDRFLPYIAGGVAFAQYDVDNTVRVTTSRMLDKTVTGWTIGAGVDYAFTDNLIGRAEYRYSDFGSRRADEGIWQPFHADLSTNEVRIGFAYKF